MKTISLEVSEKTAEAIKRMSEDELKKLKEKGELYFSVRRELGHYSQQSTLQQIAKETQSHDRWIDHLIAAFGHVAYQHEQGEMN